MTDAPQSDAPQFEKMSENGVAPVYQAPRAPNGTFRKGFSGNPWGEGRAKQTPDYKRCRELCRKASEQSALGMIELATESLDHRVRFMAYQWVYEQAWGKAREYDPKEDAPPPINLMRLDAAQREELRGLLRKAVEQPRLPAPDTPDPKENSES